MKCWKFGAATKLSVFANIGLVKLAIKLGILKGF